MNPDYPHDIFAAVGFIPPFVCVSVFLYDISKTDAARITQPDIQMFQDKSWKPVYFGIEVLSQNIAGVGLCTLVSACFFQFTCAIGNGHK